MKTVKAQSITPEVVAEEFYKLAKRYGTQQKDYKNESEGKGSDRCNSGYDIKTFSVKRGKLELVAREGSRWTSYGTFSVDGSSHSFSDVNYLRNGRTVFSASRDGGGERYHDSLISGERKTERATASGWDIHASNNTKKNLVQIVEELRRKLKPKH